MARAVAVWPTCFWRPETVFNRLRGVGFFLMRQFVSLPKVLFDFMWLRINLYAVGDARLR